MFGFPTSDLTLSVILTLSVLFPNAANEQVILGILGGGGVVSVIVALVIMALSQNGGSKAPAEEVAAATMSNVRLGVASAHVLGR